jgi:hypothetical protein
LSSTPSAAKKKKKRERERKKFVILKAIHVDFGENCNEQNV